MRRQDVNPVWRTIFLLLIVFFVPLPVIITSGMEHTLQCLFCFLFITEFAQWLEQNGKNKKSNIPWALLIYGILVTTIRYEGLFLIAIASLILFWYKKIGFAFLLGAASLAPLLIFGFYSVSVGSYFLPNSVLVKSETISFSLKGIVDFFSNTLIYKYSVVKDQSPSPSTPPPGISLLAAQRLLLILPVFYLLFKERVSQKRSYNLIYLMIVFCVLMHLAFAATGWFYRYESYLVCISLIIVFVSVYKYGSSFFSLRNFSVYLFSAVILFALFFPLVLRSSAGFSKAKQACVNVYEQQYQTASFIKSSYDSAVVAANDIGALSYYTNAKTIDLWGLGNIDVAKSKKEKRCTPQFLDSLVKSKHVQLAIVYDEWFDSALLSNWTKVATWTVRDNVILGGDTVSFYTINKEDAPDLEKKLQTFESSLPKNILVKYSNE